jgi:hypothetical protein
MAASNMRHPARPLIMGGIVFLIAASLSGLIVWQMEQQSIHDERMRVTRLASDHVYVIERTIEHALSATQSLATLVRQGNGNIANSDAIVKSMLPYYPGASELALAPGGVIRDIAPMSGNEMAKRSRRPCSMEKADPSAYWASPATSPHACRQNTRFRGPADGRSNT